MNSATLETLEQKSWYGKFFNEMGENCFFPNYPTFFYFSKSGKNPSRSQFCKKWSVINLVSSILYVLVCLGFWLTRRLGTLLAEFTVETAAVVLHQRYLQVLGVCKYTHFLNKSRAEVEIFLVSEYENGDDFSRSQV